MKGKPTVESTVVQMALWKAVRLVSQKALS